MRLENWLKLCTQQLKIHACFLATLDIIAIQAAKIGYFILFEMNSMLRPTLSSQ